jgi:hypothetical protein
VRTNSYLYHAGRRAVVTRRSLTAAFFDRTGRVGARDAR